MNTKKVVILKLVKEQQSLKTHKNITCTIVK